MALLNDLIKVTQEIDHLFPNVLKRPIKIQYFTDQLCLNKPFHIETYCKIVKVVFCNCCVVFAPYSTLKSYEVTVV